MIKGITEKTGATINIDQEGGVTIYCREKEKAEEALSIIQSLVEDPEVGRWYMGTVKRITDFGAFVEFMPGRDGLVHISRMAETRVERVTDILKEGQEVKIKLYEIDRMGRLNLTMVELQDRSRSDRPRSERERSERPRSDGDSDRNRSSGSNRDNRSGYNSRRR